MIHHRKSDFTELLLRVAAGLKELFVTDRPVISLACSGTGAMDCAVANLFSPGERVLVVVGGKFGERWAEIAGHYALDVAQIDVPWGASVSPDAVREELARRPDTAAVLVQACETSTGALHPLQELGRICAEGDTLLVADGISAVGVSPCPMDDWGIDCLVTGSQKGLMLPPGLAFISLSDRAWQRAEARTSRSFYFNLPAERDKILKGQTQWTSAVNLFFGLEASLRLFHQAGLDAIHRRQAALTAMVRAGVAEIGLELLVKSGYAWGLTSIALPPAVDGLRLLKDALETHGVVFAGGQGAMKGRIVRFGHMGHVDYGDVLAGLHALRHAYAACGGFSAGREYLEAAAAAYDAAMNQTAA